MHKRHNQLGVTFAEVVMTIALLTIIAGVSTPVIRQFQVKNDLDVGVQTLVQNLRRAQTLASAEETGTTWGVRIATGSITLFSGTSYATRNTAQDEVTNISTAITLSGDTEIVFTQLTGELTSNKSITLTSTTNDIRTITINTKATIDY